jgi:hypothetical protein
MDNNDESVLKQQYINEQIIEKGYNPEDLSNFVSRRRGVKLEELPFNVLKKSIEQFKNERLNLTYNVSKQKKEEENKANQVHQAKVKSIEKEKVVEKEKEESLFEQLYSSTTYDLECRAQEENPLKILETQNVRIKITVSDPKKVESTGFFKSTFYTYLVSCKDINSSVRRTYNDFEWLHDRLISQYTYRYVPPLLKYLKIFENTNDETINMRIRYLNKFFDELINKRLLRTSLVLYAFLTLPDDKFEKLRNQKEGNYILNKNLTNFVNYSGKLNFELTKDKIIFVNSLDKLITPTTMLLDKLNITYTKLSEDLTNVTLHLQELSDTYAKLKDETRRYRANDSMKNVYETFSKAFKLIGDNVVEQRELLNTHVKEHFEYLKMEYEQVINLTRHFDTQRNMYEGYCKKLKGKKEQLFMNRNVAKWELDPDDNEVENANDLVDNKKLAFEKMCYKENIEKELMKKKLVLIMEMIFKAMNKLNKYQGEQMDKFVKMMNKEFGSVCDKECNLIKLLAKAI